MGVYGRFFDFAASPIPQHRQGFHLTTEVIPQGAPFEVVPDSEPDANGRLPVRLCTDSVGKPIPNQHGIALYEVPPRYYAGVDPLLTNPSDIVDIPAGVAIQAIHGTEVIGEWRNGDEFSFDGQRTYPGRVMVAGISVATPEVFPTVLLMPGPGNDDDGYWQVTDDPDEAWLSVVVATKIEGGLGRDATLAVVQANMLF